MNAISDEHAVLLCLALLFAATSALGTAADGAEAGYRGLICRGVEESGRLFIGQPGFGPHLVSLFVTGPNPLSATHTLEQHVAWVSDPLHSYVPDGTGGLCVWAHPSSRDADGILALPGLTGLEVHCAGDGTSRDALWDRVLTGCCDRGRPLLWGFAADDTHSTTRINLSWYAARVTTVEETALKAALRAGAFYASNGPAIADIVVEGNTISLKLGQTSDVLWLRDGQHLPKEPGTAFSVSTAQGESKCLQWDRRTTEAGLDLDGLVQEVRGIRFVRAVVRTGPKSVALTQPWRIGTDGSLENPYPAEGTWIRGQTHNHTDAPPGDRKRIKAYRVAYQSHGQLGTFSTDYSYWETPYQWLPSDGVPHIESVSPSRCRQGEEVELAVEGVNFGHDCVVQLDEHRLPVSERSNTGLRARVSADLPPGQYDVCVTNPKGFRGTLPAGLTVQSRDTSTDGWRNFTVADGLAHAHNICVACVGDEVWAGSICGVSRHKKRQWEVFRREVPGGSAYAMLADMKGGLWIAGGRGMIFRGPDGEWWSGGVGCTDKLGNRHGSERWGRMALDEQGALWVTTRWGRGMAVRRDNAWERLTTADGLPSNSPSAVACNGSGTLWACFSNGLHRRVAGKWERVALPKTFEAANYASAIAAGPDGAVWVALTSGWYPSVGGVLRFHDDKTTELTPTNSPLPSSRIRDILVARTGAVWFASDLGVARLDTDGKWRTFTTVNSGPGCDIVLGLAEDCSGRIWLATADGVSCYSPG